MVGVGGRIVSDFEFVPLPAVSWHHMCGRAPAGPQKLQPELQLLGLSTHFLLGSPLGWGLPLTPGPVPRAMSTLFPSLLHQFLTLYSVQSLSVISLWGSRWRWGWG